MSNSDFAYTQARIQARYAALPGEAEWQRLGAARTLSGWLEDARNGPLKAWVKGFSAQSTSADIERGVRALFLDAVDDTVRVVPPAWRAAVDWCRWLALLSLFEHLRAGRAAPAWVGADPHVGPLLGIEPQPFALNPTVLHAAARYPAARYADALAPDASEHHRATDRGIDPNRQHARALAALLDGSPAAAKPPAGSDLLGRWRALWLARWPRGAGADHQRLLALIARIETHRVAFAAVEPATPAGADAPRGPARTWVLRRRLREGLRLAFHRHLLQPATPFIYLALVALDLERLRRALLDRALYPNEGHRHAQRADQRPPLLDPDLPVGAAHGGDAGATRPTAGAAVA